MENYELSKEDQENINKLISIGKSLLENFNKLKELELQNKQESNEYIQTIVSLKSTLSLEDTILDNLGNDPFKIFAMMLHFDKIEHAMNIEDDMNVVKSNDSKKLINKRILLLLNFKNHEYLNDKIQFIANTVPVSNSFLKVLEGAKIDFLNTILYLLNRYLKDPMCSEIKEELLNFKYNLVFIYKYITDNYIENNFHISEYLYWTCELITEVNGLPQNKASEARGVVALNLYKEQANLLFNANEKRVQRKDNFAKVIISEIIVRAIFMTLDEKTKNDLKKEFLVNANNAKLLGYDNFGDILLEIFNASEQDKIIPNIVTLIRSK